MPSKSRHRSRGSRSFLSNDLLRSITRGRSYHTVETSVSNSDLRSQSSLSCDPNAQSQPKTNRMGGLHHGLSASSNNFSSATPEDFESGSQARVTGPMSDSMSKHGKRRRTSWFSKPWSRLMKDGKPYSMTTLPPTTSMSSISKSSISSPVLTSTTNPRVANRERMPCSQVLFPISSPQQDHTQGADGPEADETSTIHAVDNNSSWTLSVRNITAKLGHSRRASTGVLSSSWSRRRFKGRDHAGSSSTSSHWKATMAMKGRIQQLGERLHVLPIEPGNAVANNAGMVKAQTHDPHRPDNSRTPTPRATPLLPGLRSDSTTHLLRGSLTRSFASAVDRLDPNSSPTLVNHSPSMSNPQRMKSLIKMYEGYNDGAQTPKKTKTPSKDVRTDMSKLPRKEDKTRTFDNSESAEVSRTRSERSQTGVTERDDPFNPSSTPPGLPEERQVAESGSNDPCSLPTTHPDGTQSPSADVHVPSALEVRAKEERDMRRKYDLPRIPHANPLRSNTDVMFFAEPGNPPPEPAVHQKPAPVRPALDKGVDNDDPHALGEAPIYSPSTGDLSQYVRTPSPKSKAEPAATRARVPAATPTKQSTLGGRLKHSVSGFFVKSASKLRLTSSTSRQIKVQRESEQEEEQDQERDAGSKSVQTPVHILKRGVFDHQPVTPSSLRYESRPDVSERAEVNRERAATMPSSAPVSEFGSELTQSRSRTTNLDPRKRRAMYGDEDFKNFRVSRIQDTKPYNG